MDDNKFEFSGFLENNETFEVPDKSEKRKSKNGPFGGMEPPNLSPEDIKNLLGGMYPIENGMAEMTDIGGIENMVNSIMSRLMNVLGDEEFDDEEDEEEQQVLDEDPCIYELGKVEPYLDAKSFGSIECLENEDLYEEFKAKVKKKKSIMEIFNNKKGSNITNIDNPLVQKLPFDKIESLDLIEIINSSSVLLYAKPQDSSLTGFFMVLYEDVNKDFKFLVPVYGNTFKYDKSNNEVDLYTVSETRRLFKDDIPGGQTNFKVMILPALKFFTNFTLTTKNKNKYTIMAADVGTFKNVMPAIHEATDILKVGSITFNSSSKAEMIKGFSGIKSNGPYPFYFKFNERVDKDDLILLSQLLFKVDLNNCNLMKNKEINTGFNGNDIYFYIVVDQLDLY